MDAMQDSRQKLEALMMDSQKQQFEQMQQRRGCRGRRMMWQGGEEGAPPSQFQSDHEWRL